MSLQSEMQNIISDRYLASMYAINFEARHRPFFDYLMELFHKTLLTVVLYADTETHRQRIYHRNANDPDLRKSILEERYQKIRDVCYTL